MKKVCCGKFLKRHGKNGARRCRKMRVALAWRACCACAVGMATKVRRTGRQVGRLPSRKNKKTLHLNGTTPAITMPGVGVVAER